MDAADICCSVWPSVAGRSPTLHRSQPICVATHGHVLSGSSVETGWSASAWVFSGDWLVGVCLGLQWRLVGRRLPGSSVETGWSASAWVFSGDWLVGVCLGLQWRLVGRRLPGSSVETGWSACAWPWPTSVVAYGPV